MIKPEQRRTVRKTISMPCILLMSNGVTFYGYSKEVSLNGLFVECAAQPRDQRRPPNIGDVGMLTLRYRQGNQELAMSLRSQLVRLAANGIGVSIRFAELSKTQQRILGLIITAGKAQI